MLPRLNYLGGFLGVGQLALELGCAQAGRLQRSRPAPIIDRFVLRLFRYCVAPPFLRLHLISLLIQSSSRLFLHFLDLNGHLFIAWFLHSLKLGPGRDIRDLDGSHPLRWLRRRQLLLLLLLGNLFHETLREQLPQGVSDRRFMFFSRTALLLS